MLDDDDKAEWLSEHEWLVHELLHETRKLARCLGKVDGATQRGYDMALQALLAHARNVDPRHLVVAGRGGVGSIPYALYAASRAEVPALRRAAQEEQANTTKLTRDDTKALWHAVEAQGAVIKDCQRRGFTLDDLHAERATRDAARAALRKVNAIRQAQAEERAARRGRGERECL
ncbi:hypothetical protein AVHY2522_13635 [Acidovorax sp. SUPP2522]|uniref:hypothetical protein n=1 Tax=unclassified Acidovorax TaxID=2684926 RepID=UPI00234ADC1D|nr:MULTISPECIES: hypothetical protein [unclassified Acidovorax]WCM96269.1 hypothetical protein M5C96_17760 [Acidovorax sp. GBBC 1281]GKT16982.1 hypothetical protein AVHY2522_13635 [Acidovorax sp. SUPP2522]